MELARHSDVKMTMRYTHIGIGDQADALKKLPSPTAIENALHGRCVSGGAESPKETLIATTETDHQKKKRRKSYQEANFGVLVTLWRKPSRRRARESNPQDNRI
jgi:hypothetical protein